MAESQYRNKKTKRQQNEAHESQLQSLTIPFKIIVIIQKNLQAIH